MTNFLKNIVVVIGVLAISAGIFVLVTGDKELKEDILSSSLRGLGNQLIQLIPEAKSEEQENLKAKWDEFSHKAQKGEIPADKVESVAVGILNASNLDENFSVEDAEVILNFALPNEEEATTTWEADEVHASAEEGRVVKEKNTRSAILPNGRLAALGEELAALCRFNERIREASGDDHEKRRVFVEHFRYSFDNGIKLSADVGLKKRLGDARFKIWNDELDRLEEKELVEWRQNFAMELDQDRLKLKMQLDSLKVILATDEINIEWKEIMGDLKELEQLKALEKLQHWQVVSPEFIEKVVTESLSHAGVKVEK